MRRARTVLAALFAQAAALLHGARHVNEPARAGVIDAIGPHCRFMHGVGGYPIAQRCAHGVAHQQRLARKRRNQLRAKGRA